MDTTLDIELQRRVRNMLSQRQSLRGVEVAAEGSRIILQGKVRSFYDRQLCISGAQRVAGVYELVDEIQVA